MGGSGGSNVPAGTPGDEIRWTELPFKGHTPLGPGSNLDEGPCGPCPGAACWLSRDDLDFKHAPLWSDLRGLVQAQGIWLPAGPLGSQTGLGCPCPE